MEGGEGDVAQEVRVDALPEVEHAVDARLAAHALDRSDETAGHAAVKKCEKAYRAWAWVFRNSSGSTQTTASARASPPLMAGTIQETLGMAEAKRDYQWFVK